MLKILMTSRPGRFFVRHGHRLFHPGATGNWAFRFQKGGCWLCDRVWSAMYPMIEGLEDQSSIPVGEGVTMTATAKRQLEALSPEDRARVEEAMAAIVDDHRQEPE